MVEERRAPDPNVVWVNGIGWMRADAARARVTRGRFASLTGADIAWLDRMCTMAGLPANAWWRHLPGEP